MDALPLYIGIGHCHLELRIRRLRVRVAPRAFFFTDFEPPIQGANVSRLRVRITPGALFVPSSRTSFVKRSPIEFSKINFEPLRSTPVRVPMRELCQSVACSNHAGGIAFVIARVARRSHINFTTIIKHIFHTIDNLRSTPVRVPMRGLSQSVGSSHPHKGNFVSPGAFFIRSWHLYFVIIGRKIEKSNPPNGSNSYAPMSIWPP